MSAVWTWLLCDAQGSALAELTTATARSLTFRRNTYGEATFVISHDDEAASLLHSALRNTGVPTLRCYRRGNLDTIAVLRFNGYLAGLTESLEDSAALTAVFRGPFGRVIGDGPDRGRFTLASTSFSADAGQIAKALIDLGNAQGATGLATTGTIQPTKTRTRLYQYANIGEAVVALTQILDGFDFEEVYVEQGTTLAIFNVYTAQGQDRPAGRFEYGPETLMNVRSVQRVVQAPINVARVLGANGLVGSAQNDPSITKYGVWWTQQSASDVVEQATLDDKAQALLRPNPVKTIQFVPDLAISPLPWDDFWLGDTIRFYARRGAFTEDLTVRVNAITIVIDDNGLEQTEIDQDDMALLESDPAGGAYDQAIADAAQAAADAVAEKAAVAATTIDVEPV
jgi:hypothetical protein